MARGFLTLYPYDAKVSFITLRAQRSLRKNVSLRFDRLLNEALTQGLSADSFGKEFAR